MTLKKESGISGCFLYATPILLTCPPFVVVFELSSGVAIEFAGQRVTVAFRALTACFKEVGSFFEGGRFCVYLVCTDVASMILDGLDGCG